MSKLILASTSPRRHALLAATGLNFTVIPSDYEEDNSLPLPPARLVQHLAEGKANAVASRHPGSIVIGADTLVVIDGRVLGKPADSKEVAMMITSLSGRWHSVFTGCVVVRGDERVGVAAETRVHFRNLTPSEIQAYAQLKEPLDKAGAYGIQTTAGIFIDAIDGDYFSMVGLPISWLAENLPRFGVDLVAATLAI